MEIQQDVQCNGGPDGEEQCEGRQRQIQALGAGIERVNGSINSDWSACCAKSSRSENLCGTADCLRRAGQLQYRARIHGRSVAQRLLRRTGPSRRSLIFCSPRCLTTQRRKVFIEKPATAWENTSTPWFIADIRATAQLAICPTREVQLEIRLKRQILQRNY